MDAVKAVQTRCSHASLVSGVLANYYSTPLLELERGKVTGHGLDTFAQEPEAARMNHQIPVTAGLFVDDEPCTRHQTAPISMQSDYRRHSRKS